MEAMSSKRKWDEEDIEKSRLMELEAIIHEHLGSGKFFLVAAALREIDECHLYKPEKSIYTYAKNKFMFSRRTTNTYLCSASVYESIVEDNTLPIPVNISHIRSLHKFPAEVRRYIWKQVCDSGQNITEENVVAMTIKYETGVAFTNLNNELYTPKNIIIAAKQVLGRNCFDLDPASCDFANSLHENKIAKVIFNEQLDGLKQTWFGDVWLHPPNYSDKVSKSGNFQEKWFKSAEERFNQHEINSCFILLKVDFGKNWFMDALKYPYCIFNKKIPFATPTGREKVIQDASHMLIYMGTNIIDFCTHFGNMGSIPGYNSWTYNSLLTNGIISLEPNNINYYQLYQNEDNGLNLQFNESNKKVKRESEANPEVMLLSTPNSLDKKEIKVDIINQCIDKTIPLEQIEKNGLFDSSNNQNINNGIEFTNIATTAAITSTATVTTTILSSTIPSDTGNITLLTDNNINNDNNNINQENKNYDDSNVHDTNQILNQTSSNDNNLSTTKNI